MILCLDIGNTQIFGCVFQKDEILFTFRHDAINHYTSDQLGIFFKNILSENDIATNKISKVAICSVAPHLNYPIKSACKKYLLKEPFVLQNTSNINVKIKIQNPNEVGPDLIAGAIAAVKLFPNKNRIVADFGTATTICPINANNEFLGGVVMPGVRLCMESLEKHTAKLPSVNIVKPKNVLGQSTVTSIQSGIYYSQLSTIKEIKKRFTAELFDGSPPVVIGTGGFAHLFDKENVFDTISPYLVLEGLLESSKTCYSINQP